MIGRVVKGNRSRWIVDEQWWKRTGSKFHCAATKVPSKVRRVKKRVKALVRQTGPGTMSLGGGGDYGTVLSNFKILNAKRYLRRKNKNLMRIRITVAS